MVLKEKTFERFTCKAVDTGLRIRCPVEIFRENVSDLIEFPYCEDCQLYKLNKVYRLNDGNFIN